MIRATVPGWQVWHDEGWREIVQLLAEGNSNKDIARLLTLSVKTVETHRAAVMRKLELNSLADIIRWAIRNKVIQP